MKYYHCLWYKENPILHDYREGYIKLLQGYARSLGMKEIVNNAKFLIISDVATTLEGNHTWKISSTEATHFLSEEYKNYRAKNYTSLFSQEGHVIPDTNILITLADKNPDRAKDTHPGHKEDGVHIEWWNTPIEEWVSLYKKSLDLLAQVSPDFHSELSQIIHKIIPLGESRGCHNSSSYSSCIGQLYMSFPIGDEFPELTVLDAIIHESNHNKLNLILKQDPLILNDKREIYYSPYRPDPRHMHGIYLWLHALSGVSHIVFRALAGWLVPLSDLWQEKMLLCHMNNALSIRVLERYGIFSEVWNTIFFEMKHLHAETNIIIQWLGLSPQTRNTVTEKIKEQFFSVSTRFPNIFH